MHRSRRYLTLLLLTTLLSTTVVPFAYATEPALPAVVDAQLSLDDVAVSATTPAPRDATAARAATRAVRTTTVEAPIAFTALWAQLPEGLDEVRVRTSVDGVAWTPWYPLAVDDGLQAPDPGTDEAAGAVDVRAARNSELLTTLEGRYVEVEAATEAVTEVTLGFLDAGGLNESAVARFARLLTPRPVAAEARTVPDWIHSRAEWGAAPYRGTPDVASDGVRQVVVHHTAGANNLVRADGTCARESVISTLRGIQRYHQDSNGWSDVGYNVIIDPCGGVWEGRQGGLDRAVVGAHARGYNTGSTGVSVLGNYVDLTPNARILEALDRVVGWKAGIHGIDTGGTVTIGSRTFPTVVGHRDVGSTSCPGRIADHLPRIRSNAEAQSSQWPRVPDGLGAATFSDTSGSPHEVAIEQLVEREITTGYDDGTFRPQNQVTRGQVASFLRRALALEPVEGDGFSDVAGSPHESSIYALSAAGVLGGYDDGTFRPQEPLRREHMAAILTRALELELDEEAGRRFPDVVAYAGEIGAIANVGITTGKSDGTFAPKETATRGQMATFLINALRVLDERAATE